MTTPETIVIVGAGLAGTSAAKALPEQRFTGRVVLVGDQSERPNDRPRLFNTYLAGTASKGARHAG